MYLHLLTRHDEIADVREDWTRLARLAPRAGMFATPEWHEGWLEHVAPDAEPRIVVVADGSGRVVGLAPFCDWPYRDHGFSIPSFRFTGREVISGDYLDVLAVPGAYGVALSHVLDLLVQEMECGRMLVLGEILEDSSLDRALRRRFAREDIAFDVGERRCCPFLHLPESYDAYLDSLSRNLRSNLRKYTRRVTGKEGARVTRLQGPAAQARLQDLIRLHGLRWQADDQAGNFVRPGFRAFLEHFVANPPDGVEPNLYLLETDRTHAALLAFHGHGVAMTYSSGWDPASPLARFSPLLVLLGNAIRTAIEEHIRVVDLLRGDSAYKLSLASGCRHTGTFLTHGRNLRSLGYFAAMKLGSALRRLKPAA